MFRSARYRVGAACYRPLAVTDGYHRPGDAAEIRPRFPACPVATELAGPGANSAAEAARAAGATVSVERVAAAATAGAEETGVSDAAVEREDAAAAAAGAATYFAERTRAAQHSSDPNNPRC